MNKYIDAEKLKAEIERHIKHYEKLNCDDFKNGELYICQELLSFVKSLQQEQPKKYIELNGIKYREVPAKTNDKICKDCDYFLDNGTCELVDCPCIDDNTILERLNEQPEVDLEEEIAIYLRTFSSSFGNGIEYAKNIARHFYELGLKARKEE